VAEKYFTKERIKNIIGIKLSFIVGSIIGFFGVFASVFTDGGLTERLIVISVILLIYSILSSIFGYSLPKYSWKWGLFITVPGVLLLSVFLIRERNLYHVIYMILIICFACLGAWLGSFLRKRSGK